MTTSIETADGSVIFASPDVLRDAFEERLLDLLAQDSLGVFILVLANASFERSSFERMQAPLASAYVRWRERFDRGDARASGAPVDDVEVFRQLRRIGFDRLSATRCRRLGPWELQFNQLRGLRPPRMSHAVVGQLYEPFDRKGFHFDKPFLRKEIFWENELAGAPVRLLYNKFPFAELHGLLVPHPEDGRAQFLKAQDHGLVWAITRQLGGRLPGLGFGYNAQGAYASVNHLHFQMFMRSSGVYPIESPHWRHNGGDAAYPLPVQRHIDSGAAWDALQRLHTAGHAYNLLYRPKVVYIVERAKQGSYAHSDWAGGFAWSELAGAVTVSDSADFERLSEADLWAEYGRLAIKP